MKAISAPNHYPCQPSDYRRFPNQASRRVFWERFLDAALAAATALAIVTILLFILALG